MHKSPRHETLFNLILTTHGKKLQRTILASSNSVPYRFPMGYQLGIGGSTLYDKAFVVKNALANKKRSCGTRRLDYVPK